jgi:hypothetical protein
MPRREWALGLAAISLPLLAVVLAAAQTYITICHHPGPFEDPFGNPVTLIIPVSALQGHLGHGDTIGPCGPQATPRPTPKATPQPTPKPTPRPTPGPTARPTPTPKALPSPPLPTHGPSTTVPPIPPTDT